MKPKLIVTLQLLSGLLLSGEASASLLAQNSTLPKFELAEDCFDWRPYYPYRRHWHGYGYRHRYHHRPYWARYRDDWDRYYYHDYGYRYARPAMVVTAVVDGRPVISGDKCRETIMEVEKKATLSVKEKQDTVMAACVSPWMLQAAEKAESPMKAEVPLKTETAQAALPSVSAQ